MVLVTTAINDLLELEDDILLLGAWCRGYSLSSKNQKLVKKTLDYHWIDRNKFFKDQNTIIALYDKLLPRYSESLNLLHNVSYSTSFWRIIIGPWLLLFISSLFDRWCSISQALEEELDYVALSFVQESEMIATNMEDFYKKSAEDKWNNYIFSKIVKNWTSLEFKELPLINQIIEDHSPSIKSRIKKLNKKLLHKLSFFSLSNEIVFFDAYMPISSQWTLEKLLGQKRSYFHFYTGDNLSYKEVDRSNLTIKYQPKNELEAFIISMVPDQIPKSYIENFDCLLTNANNKNLPNSPKIIFTSNAHFFNDQFKFWSAMHKENGSKFILGQHGGGIGSMQVVLSEYMEKSIADKYVTWGWDDANFSNIAQLPALKLLKSKKYKPKKGLLHVMDDNSRYSRSVSSTPISSLHINYLEDQYLLSNLIDHELVTNYVVRNCPNNYNWEYKESWNPNVKFDSNKYFLKSIYEHKLVVISSNSTTFLQVLAANIPTVIFLTSKYNEIRDESRNDYDDLKKVHIFFDSSELASRHINSIWSDISSWWQSKELQLARIEFCNKYARTTSDSLFQWKSFFEEINK